MDSSLQIDNIQTFFKVIGYYESLWKLLLGREIIHFVRGRAKVNAVNNESSEIVIYSNYTINGKIFFRYTKEKLLQEFGEIYPPISIKDIIGCGEINPLLRSEEIIKLIQTGKAEKQEAERQVIERQEAERRKAERLNVERRKQEAERREAVRLEAERRKQEAERRQFEKQALLSSLQEQFKQDFLRAYNFYTVQCSEHMSFEEYQLEKSNYIQSWVQCHLNSKPDIEQAAAIGAVEGHVQVVARAGSGKTSTLVNRALFLQKHCGIAPDEMLLLAFNRKAAEEIRERLTVQLQGSIPHVMTFHALAYALVHPEDSILFDEPDGQQTKSRALQTVIDFYLRDPYFYEKIRALMMAHFREDWERIALGGYEKSPQEMLSYRRSLPREGLDGTYFKSFGEKLIADFLFEHEITYRYERNFWWNGVNYRPDFTVFSGDNQGIVIEYFGLKGDPDYDVMSDEKRDYWRNKPNWRLLEFVPRDITSRSVEGFCVLLKQSLEESGITCNRLSEEDIWYRIKNRAIDRFTKLVVGFTQRCRKLSLTPERLAEIVDSYYYASDGEQLFLDLAQKFYQSYLEYLEATGEEDFDGLIQKAAEAVALGQTVFRRKSGTGNLKCLRYVFIDEYQDFSELFHRLIKAVREQNPQAHFFCVGDDWQAINGFAGSDLRFYQNFGQFFQPSCKLNISTNYRSATSIVNIGNALMQGLGTPACAYKSELGIVEIADIGKFHPVPKEEKDHPGDSLTPAVLRLVDKALKNSRDVILLSRKNSLPWYVNFGKQRGTSRDGTLDSFLKLVRSYFPEDLRNKVNISTAHKYKGLEKKVVIVLDAVPRCYPLLHSDLMFTRCSTFSFTSCLSILLI